MTIKPTHKIKNKKSLWYGRTWAEVIDVCVGHDAQQFGWQCGIHSMDPSNYDNDNFAGYLHANRYYIWYFLGEEWHTVIIPKSLSKYVQELCKKRRFVL